MQQESRKAYDELLRDPRWQKKRLDVMADAGWKCELCTDPNEELNVHHDSYVADRMPWDYPRSELKCLCRTCHTLSHLPTAKVIHFTRTRLLSAEVDKILQHEVEQKAREKVDSDHPEVAEQRRQSRLNLAKIVDRELRGPGRPSKLLPPEEVRLEVIAGWLAEGARDYRELGRRLGGVSGATALRLVRKHRQGLEFNEEENPEPAAPAVTEVE